MKRIALLTLGFLLVCNCAFAAVNDLGTFSFVEPETKDFYALTGLGEFEDEWTFSVPETELEVVAVSSNSRFFDIENLSASIWEKDGSSSIYDASFSTINDSTTGVSFDVFSYSNLQLLAGEYILKISGTGTTVYSNYDGFISSNPAPVPVPAAALLLGAGLLGIVGIRRRQTV